jgi:hypothetical protein
VPAQDVPKPISLRPPVPVQPPAGLPQTNPVQPPESNTKRSQDTDLVDEGQFEPPTPEELFRLESVTSYLQRQQLKKRIQLNNPEYGMPAETPITGTHQPRSFAPTEAIAFPSYVVYHPLYFQQINAERYGWELGVFQPVVSTAQFYADVLLLPYKTAANPPWTCDANVGYNLPGNPEPLRFLTVPFSWRGVAAQTGAAVAGAAIFP